MDIAARLGALRQVLSRAGAQAFMLPVADEHLGEYVPDCARRLAWLTGFTGSAGLAVVLAGEAALFMDGRYTLQARDEAPDFTLYNSGDVKPEAWLASAVPEDAVVGFDPWLHSMREMKRFRHAAKAKNIRFTPLTPNPVDALWQDRPATPAAPAFIHPLAYAGVDHAQKRTQAATAIRAANADFAVLAASDSINWLLNIRGHDLACSPMVLAYAIVSADGKVQLFSDTKKFLPELREHLGAEVTLHPVSALEARLADLRGRVLADPTLTPEWFAQSLSADIVPADDPCQRLKAIKNPTELSGMRAAHIRDGAAVVRLLHWLDEAVKKSPVSELEVVKRLHAFRAEAAEFVSPSFDTIAGSGPHGAIVHYRATQKTDRALQQGELFLLDSGGQYPDGTTDITRTVPIGAPGGEQRDRFTRVLKGHIALAAALFPEGTSGSQLDALARAALWQAGLDYDHGTGHGVGYFLNVHEGPQRIGKRGGDVALAPGMIISNEPGYYKEGAYGIRIENLVAVVSRDAMENGRAQLGFETLTAVPIDTRLVLPELLMPAEKEWLNAYHRFVASALAPLLENDARRWLEARCEAI